MVAKYWTVAFKVLGGVLAVYFLLGFCPYLVLGNGNDPTAGLFGDSFGFINSLFSSLAFAALFLTLLIQINEFHESREARQLEQAIQTAISNQQSISSLISGISTWQQIHGDRKVPTVKQVDFTELTYWYGRATNLILLEAVKDNQIAAIVKRSTAFADMTIESIRSKSLDQLTLAACAFRLAAWVEDVPKKFGRDPSRTLQIFKRQMDRLKEDLDKVCGELTSMAINSSEDTKVSVKHLVDHAIDLYSTVEKQISDKNLGDLEFVGMLEIYRDQLLMSSCIHLGIDLDIER